MRLRRAAEPLRGRTSLSPAAPQGIGGLWSMIRPGGPHPNHPAERGELMARDGAIYVCQSCGAVHPKWSGQCDACGGWNTLVEETTARPPGALAPARASKARGLGFEGLDTETPEPGSHRDGPGGVRPRLRRRRRAGLGDPAGRRSRRRQVDAAAAGLRLGGGPGRVVRLHLRRGGGGAGALPRLAHGPGPGAGEARRRDLAARHPRRAQARAFRPGGHRFDPDPVERRARGRPRAR